MCKKETPVWQDKLSEILKEEELTGTVTLHCQSGKVKQFEVMRRYKTEEA